MMTVSPRKKVTIVGTRSLRGAKVSITEEHYVAGSSYTFKGSPELSPSKSVIKKKVSPKAKGRRQSLLLKRLEDDGAKKLSPIMSRRSRRTSMINVSSQKTLVTETSKIVRSTSDKVLPTRGRPKKTAGTASKPLPPKSSASKISTAKSPVKPVSPSSPKESSTKNLKKNEVLTKVTVKSANINKGTKTVSKTSTRRSSAVKSPSQSPLSASPQNTPKDTKVSTKATSKSTKTASKSTKTTKTTKEESKIEAKDSSPEAEKPKEVTFSPIKFYSSPKKSQTPLKRKSLILSIDQDVSFNYSPVDNKKRKFDGSPTPEADSEKKSKKRKIDRSAVKSKLPILEKNSNSKETPKTTKSVKATHTKAVKTPKEESSTKSPKQAPKSAKVKTPKGSSIKSPILGRRSSKKPVVVISPLSNVYAKSLRNKKSVTKSPDSTAQSPMNDKKSIVKKSPDGKKSVKSSAKKATPSPKVGQQKKVQSVNKTAKKVKITATSPEETGNEYRKTPKAEKQRKSDAVSDVGASPELNSAVELLANIRASPIKSKAKLKPYTPKPDPTPSRVLKQTMKKKAAKDLQALKNIKTSSLVDSEIVVMKTPVQLTRTPLRKTAAVTPDTPSSTSNLPPTPTSSRRTLQAKRSRSVAKRELNRPSPPRSSTPIEGENSPEPQIADPDVTDINDDIHLVKEISATITTTEVITTEVTSTSMDGEINGITAIVSEEKTAVVSGDNVSMASSDLNGSALAVANDSQENPPSKSRWRYCSVM